MTVYSDVEHIKIGKHFSSWNYKPKLFHKVFPIVLLSLVLVNVTGCTTLTAYIPSDKSFPIYQSDSSSGAQDDSCKSDSENNHSKHNVQLIAPEERKRISEELLPFAQMSSSAYQDPKKQIRVDGWERYGRYENPWLGFGADIYENENTHDRAIAYRGTSPSFGIILDFLTGNIPVIGRHLQYKNARKVFRNVKNSCQSCKIIVTGHSLGGGLAAHVSLHFKNVDVYTFNRSPLVFSKWFRENYKGRRIDVEETGEILNGLRTLGSGIEKLKFWNKYKPDHTWRYNLTGGDLIKEHSIYELSKCLEYKITNPP